MVLALLLAAACSQEYAEILPDENEPLSTAVTSETQEDICYRERMLESGWTEDELAWLEGSDITYEIMYNQGRFMEYVDDIHNNRPIGPSGTVIASRYFGGMKFDDRGVLTVSVTPGGFDDPDSSTAIEEMQALGIAIRNVVFTQSELETVSNTIWDNWDRARELGLSSSGHGAENAVTAWLDPYSDEQIAIFTNFLIEIGINPAMVRFEPAVTDEMRDWRIAAIAAAVQSLGDQIVLVGDVITSRTGISFSLENRTDFEFFYGSPWDLAYYENGSWRPVPHLPGSGGGMWTSEGMSLQGGGLQRYRQNWDWHFGELPPGRYMFIRDGSLGEWTNDGWSSEQERVYALVEFTITASCPLYLPEDVQAGWESAIHLVEYKNVNPRGMTVVVSNSSPYDIDHRVQIITIIEEHIAAQADDPWEWHRDQLPMLPVEGFWMDYLMQGEGFLPAGGELEFTIDWAAVYGELPPGEYRIVLSVGGHAHPPHPTGWAFGDDIIILFEIS